MKPKSHSLLRAGTKIREAPRQGWDVPDSSLLECTIFLRTLIVALMVFLLGGPARAQSGMVAAAHPLAIREGERVLQNGGNAIEAAVVTAAVLGVVEPYASGIGGGGFMVVRLAGTGEEFVIDSSVTAPQSTTPDMFIGVPEPEINSGGLAVGVPGALQHWDEALRISRLLLGGSLSLRDALQPAVDLAANGFEVSDTFIAILRRHRTRLGTFPDTAAIFLPNPPLQEGSLLRQPDLAGTLQMVADQGIEVFYRGAMADALADIVANPRTVASPPFPIRAGRMQPADLAAYDIQRRDVVSGTYRGLTVVSAGPPSGGITLIEMLNILEGFPFGGDAFGFQGGDTVQAMMESMKLAYADRTAFVADPAFVTVPVRGLTSRDYARTRRNLLRLDRSLRVPQAAGDPSPFDGAVGARALAGAGEEELLDTAKHESSTTHFSVIDREGNLVSYTTTLSELWGSAMVVPGFGFLLNNSLRNFNTAGTGINRPEGGKRPRSFMSPALVFNADATPRLVVGAAGGGTIPAIVLGVITGVLDHQKTIQEAISAARVVNENRSTGSSSHTRYEPGDFALPPDLVLDLVDRGQTMIQNTLPFGAVQGIAVDPATGTLSRGADPRRGGQF